MDKIYSRKRFIFFNSVNKNYKKESNNKKFKIYKLTIIITIAIFTASIIINSINPIIDKRCKNIAKSIATKISNEQASIVMNKYKYEDFCTLTKDQSGNISLISANVFNVNSIVSDIAIKIQDELNKKDNEKFYITLGSFTGSRILSGRGPKIEIKMSTIGNVDTELKSEFISEGINQTLHKIYLKISCNVIVLTPFNSIEEKIENQVLLTEAVIIGITPNTYYNFEGIENNRAIEVIK